MDTAGATLKKNYKGTHEIQKEDQLHWLHLSQPNDLRTNYFDDVSTCHTILMFDTFVLVFAEG